MLYLKAMSDNLEPGKCLLETKLHVNNIEEENKLDCFFQHVQNLLCGSHRKTVIRVCLYFLCPTWKADKHTSKSIGLITTFNVKRKP